MKPEVGSRIPIAIGTETGSQKDGEIRRQGDEEPASAKATADEEPMSIDLTDEEKVVYDLLKDNSPVDLNALKDQAGLSNKKWDLALKGLRAKELVKVEKNEEGLFVLLV